MIQQNEVMYIGTLRRPHGKQGELQCAMENAYWDEAEAEFLILSLEGILVPFRVLDWRGKGADTLIFSLKGVDSEEQAAHLVGAKAYMLRRDVAEDMEGMLTWQDLVGYDVFTPAGNSRGRVSAVNETTINTLLEMEDGSLLPIHEDFIIEIDEQTHTMVLDLPEGL